MRRVPIGLSVLLVVFVSVALAVRGVSPRPVTAHPSLVGVARGGEVPRGEPAPSPRGTSVVFRLATVAASPSDDGDVYSIETVDPALTPSAGATEPVVPTQVPSTAPTEIPSSSGVLAYAAMVGGQWDIYTTDIETGESVQLTTTPSDDVAPAWSPDGSRIAYVSGQSGSSQVWVMDRDGGNQRQVMLWTGPGTVYYVAWLPDSSQLIVTVADNAAGVARLVSQPLDGSAPFEYVEPWSGLASFSEGGDMAYTVRSDGQTDIVLDDGARRPITATDVSEDIPSINRDGTAIVYQVGSPGGRYLEIHDVTTDSTRQLVPIGDDSDPVWSPNGDRIAFVTEDGASAEIWLVGADGSGAVLVPTIEHETLWYLSWSA